MLRHCSSFEPRTVAKMLRPSLATVEAATRIHMKAATSENSMAIKKKTNATKTMYSSTTYIELLLPHEHTHPSAGVTCQPHRVRGEIIRSSPSALKVERERRERSILSSQDFDCFGLRFFAFMHRQGQDPVAVFRIHVIRVH